MFLTNYFLHLLDNIRMLSRNVTVFMDICCQVIQMRHSLFHNQLPVTHADTDLVCFVELPVQVVMLLLLVVLSQQSRSKRNTIKTVSLQLFVQILFREFLVTGQFTELRHRKPADDHSPYQPVHDRASAQ